MCVRLFVIYLTVALYSMLTMSVSMAWAHDSPDHNYADHGHGEYGSSQEIVQKIMEETGTLNAEPVTSFPSPSLSVGALPVEGQSAKIPNSSTNNALQPSDAVPGDVKEYLGNGTNDPGAKQYYRIRTDLNDGPIKIPSHRQRSLPQSSYEFRGLNHKRPDRK